eukprot:11023627-Ditylum_brightwellii.AAC.1
MGASNPQEAKVTTKAEDALNRTIKGSKLLNYCKEHFTFNPKTSKEIGWKAIGIAREKIPFQKQKWSSKVAADFLPVGCTMQDREMRQTVERPRRCSKELKTGAHIFECQGQCDLETTNGNTLQMGKKTGCCPKTHICNHFWDFGMTTWQNASFF